MPEIKNSFLQGKMNKDLDERLVPNGQYRHAENVEVSTSQGSDVGTVQNILGNKRVDLDNSFPGIPSGFKCVGSIADEKNDKLYWFVTTYDKDAIVEYDIKNKITKPVIVDKNAGNYKAVLKFYGNTITGINIIDNLLFWTDDNSDPKKINIDECKKGTPDFDTHTQLIFDHGSFDGMTIAKVFRAGYYSSDGNYTGDSSGTSVSDFEPEASYMLNRTTTERWFTFQRKQLAKLLGIPFEDFIDIYGNILNGNAHAADTDQQPGSPYGKFNGSFYPTIRHYRDGKFLGTVDLEIRDDKAGCRARAHDIDKPMFRVGDVIFGNNVNLDIEERHITVIKPKPLNAPSTKINYTQDKNNVSNIPNLFETKFPRFSYRYKYKDGEFSPFAPFTNAVFNPKYTKDKNKSIDTNVLYTQDTAYDIKEPQNKAMVNSIHSIDLTDFVTAETPEDVVEIDILYKQEDSPVIYSISSIKHNDPEWHSWSINEGENIGFGKQFPENQTWPNATSMAYAYAAHGGYTKGKYTVTTENIYAALPANQLLRPWDNVPRKALAQEITGNRIVYGNYLQNYDIGVVKPEVKISYSDRDNKIGDFSTQGLPSIKSQRNYQLGVIYCDKYGRETPVFTSNSGAISVPWSEGDGTRNASKSLQINANVANNFPEWVDSLKFFVKETSNEYYNLIMDRAWVAKKTYELDNSEGHLWISFPSSDRNKISEEDYIILKKKVGPGEKQNSFENKFKIIDIKNEAPDAIKYELVNYGAVHNNSDYFNDLFNDGYRRIDREGVRTVQVRVSEWVNRGDAGGLFEVLGQIPLEEDPDNEGVKTKDLYMSWRRLDATGVGVSSKKYKIIGGQRTAQDYKLNLSTPITKIDADIAHVDGNTTNATSSSALFHANLIFQIEKKEPKDTEDFSGKFFVKISKNQVTDLIESGKPVDLLDQYQISAKTPSWYWEDDVFSSNGYTVNLYGASSANAGADGWGTIDYGLTNWNGFDQSADQTSGGHHIHLATQNSIGNNLPTDDGNPGYLRVTDYATPWSGIRDNFGPTFFVDSMHVASMQSEVSDYAKYNCMLWAGSTIHNNRTDSNWSYAPLKTWLTDFKDSAQLLEKISSDEEVSGFDNPHEVWYEGMLMTTSPLVTNPNPEWGSKKVDGWIGSLQNVNRRTPTQDVDGGMQYFIRDNHINGLEGFITTNAVHATGPRRWFSGITGSPTDTGVGIDTKTYSNDGEVGKHFMHLSFFAPGRDLHDGSWDLDTNSSMIYGEGSWMANLQGIWGGGHFTGSTPDERFGLADNVENYHLHLPMEGNNAADGSFLPETPGPGVGYGYDTSPQPTTGISCRELHERQWDPTFTVSGDPDNKIRDFIRNLHPGSQFKFSRDTDENVYTIKKVVIKKLYNHTSWRNPFNRYIKNEGYAHPTSEEKRYWTVEKMALEWLDSESAGDGTLPNGADSLSGIGTTGAGTHPHNLKGKIEHFGASHNRRLCYIIELDKNPTASSFNPIANEEHMSAGLDDDYFTNIEFLEPVQDALLSDLNKFPAIWEVDPRKKDVDLDIYYEASNNIPVRINENTNELFAPIGCKVEVLDHASNSFTTRKAFLKSWDGAIATFDPGFARGDGVNEIDYTGLSFKFTRQDGSFTIAEAGGQQLTGEATGVKTEFLFREDVGDTFRAGLSWYNCFSFGNGIESNRIRDGFNEMFITNGVKASTTTQETYEEERRSHGLIYSGIYNSNSGVNDLNQFIMAEKSTKDLNPTYGSIQKLFQRRISLIAFCEDRVVSITSNKDAIYNADGSPQLISSNQVLGDANPFVGEYGISKNPESFASESYRAYFTDKQRGAVLRLSKDGLTPISKAGMHDWFRDNLPKHVSLLGTYDAYKENYNLTLSDNYAENIIRDSFFETGEESTTVSGGTVNRITNPGIYSGNANTYSYEEHDVLPEGNNHFGWGTVNQDFYGTVTITNHAAIPYGSEQAQQDQVDFNPLVQEECTAYVYSAVDGSLIASFTGSTEAAAIAAANAADYNVSIAIDYVQATYELGGSFGTLADSGSGTPGMFWNPVFAGASDDVWGASQSINIDSNITGYCRRYLAGNWVDETLDGAANGGPLAVNAAYPQNNPLVEREIFHYNASGSNISYMYTYTPWFLFNSQCITRDINTGTIVFDRTEDNNDFVEFRGIAHPHSINNGGTAGAWGSGNGELNLAYANAIGAQHGLTAQLNAYEGHDSIYNGDEIHIEIKLKCYTSHSFHEDYGYNIIRPKIVLLDGSSYVSDDKIWQPATNPDHENQYYGSNATDPYRWLQSTNPGTFHPYPNLPNTYYDDNGIWKLNQSPWQDYAEGTSSASFRPTDVSELDGHFYSTYAGITHGERFLTIRKSFKFIDPSQQDVLGNFTGTAPSGSTMGIEEAVVVNNLRIRISQTHGPGGLYPNGSYNTVTQHPLWGIEEVKIIKGFGVTAPYSNLAPNIASTVTTAYSAQIEGLHALDAIPPYDVPAWTEVQHHWLDDWSYDSNPFSDNVSGGSIHTWLNVFDSSIYGNNYSAVTQTQMKQDPNDINTNTYDPPSVPYTYVVPQDWGYDSSITTDQGGHTLIHTTLTDANGATPHNIAFLHDNHKPNGSAYGTIGYDNATVVSYDADYYHIKQFDSGDAYIITQDISNDPWVVNDTWYLVDVEYDEGFNANTGHGGANGLIMVHGVTSISNYVDGDIVDPKGVGTYRGGAGRSSIRLMPTVRTEYGHADGSGDNKNVLRAIFQVASDSLKAANTPTLNTFTLWVNNATNAIRLEKIITKKLDSLGPYPLATNWENSYNGTVATQAHAFSKRFTYWKNNTLYWDIPANYPNNAQWLRWAQYFNTANTQPGPEISPSGWRLNFKVVKNPHYGANNMLGEIRGWVTRDASGDASPPSNNLEGVYFSGISHEGDYEIIFNMNGDPTDSGKDDENGNPIPWRISRSTDSGATWTDYTGNITLDSVGTLMTTWSVSNYGASIGFMPITPAGSDIRFGVTDILLTDETSIFIGGSAGSWNLDGFEPSEHRWIYWDMTNQRLTFENAPSTDPDSNQVYYINANQWIDKPILEYEQYKIEFDARLDTGDFRIYYFNGDGHGFHWSDHLASSNYGSENHYSKIFTIGENNANEFDWAENPNLRDTFVVQVNGNNVLTSGYIDNITMTRVYNPSGETPKTLTFSEDVNGWTSFKSFIPENGVSLSKQYFTMTDGALWQHYTPLKDDGSGSQWVDCAEEEAENYNVFYDHSYGSSVKAVLNSEPSLIKTFNTLNYEGSQAYIKKPLSATPTPTDAGVTVHNAEAWNSGSDINGWNCAEIKTDVDMGSVIEFVKKEGKWFNYIKGKGRSSNSIDTSRFSVQGIGIVSSATDPNTNGNGNGGNGNGGNGNGAGANGGY